MRYNVVRKSRSNGQTSGYEIMIARDYKNCPPSLIPHPRPLSLPLPRLFLEFPSRWYWDNNLQGTRMRRMPARARGNVRGIGIDPLSHGVCLGSCRIQELHSATVMASRLIDRMEIHRLIVGSLSLLIPSSEASSIVNTFIPVVHSIKFTYRPKCWFKKNKQINFRAVCVQ